VADGPAMTGTPRLAVVITCFNYEAYVGHAIRSVLDQGRRDCELVVIDDGSTDGSWQVIQGFGVKAVRTPNQGQREACLAGLGLTTAPFVLFLDADDELKPGSLATILAKLDDGVAKLQFALTRIDAEGRTISSAVPALATFRDRDALKDNVLRTGVYTTPPTSGNVFRRDACAILAEASYDRAVDGVILFAAPFHGDIVSLADELGRYRIHGRNDSGLGRPPDTISLERDLTRFAQRTDHLRVHLARLGQAGALVPTDDAFFFLERSLCLDVAAGRRPQLRLLRRLLRRLWQERLPVRTRLVMSCFFVGAALAPRDTARRLLGYRFNVGRRSGRDLVQALFGGRARPASAPPPAST
jgi:glycosyltransferase involved in cell wall biosynthesis